MEPVAPQGSEDAYPLSERMPDYVVTFAIGFVGAAAVGMIIWSVSNIALASTVGYTVVLYVVVLLLAGGSSGGGYTNLGLGAMGSFFGTRRADEAQPEVQSVQKPTPQERLQKGLRPDANPRAFWQVVGGLLYIALGLAIVIVGS